MDCSTSGFPTITNSRSLLKLKSIESVMPSNHLILCCSLLLPPSTIPRIRVFSNESVLRIRWPNYWSFSFSISPSNEYSGLISFRMDWLNLIAVQGTLKSLPQHHSSKASVLRLSAFFIVQLSHPYMTTGKTKALTRWTFVGKVMSLLFNMLSRLVIAFLPRSKCLLISWLQSPSAVILEPLEIKSITVISKSFVIFDVFKDFTFVKPKCVKYSTTVALMCLCLIVYVTCLLTFWCCSTNKYLFLFFACFSTLLISLVLNTMHVFQMYDLISFGICTHSWNHHHPSQDNECIHHLICMYESITHVLTVWFNLYRILENSSESMVTKNRCQRLPGNGKGWVNAERSGN